MERHATLSPCKRYRYALWRRWPEDGARRKGQVMFIGLNPSIADAALDDPTIRRCVGFAQDWGYGSLCMANLFALRSTDPKVLTQVDDPVGPDNDRVLSELARQSSLVVAAWGVLGALQARDRRVLALLPGLHYLRLTKAGFPAHPLYLPKTLRPLPWVSCAA